MSLAKSMIQPLADTEEKSARIPANVTELINSVQIKDWDFDELEKIN